MSLNFDIFIIGGGINGIGIAVTCKGGVAHRISRDEGSGLCDVLCFDQAYFMAAAISLVFRIQYGAQLFD